MSKFFKKILWATDFSDEAQETFAYAESFAKTFKAELIAMHVVPDFSPALYSTVTSVKGDLIRRVELIKTDMKKRLDALVKEKEVSFRSVVKEGSVAKKIIETAEEEQIDLIVMGKKGLSGIEKLFLGSVANRVLRNSSVPILFPRKKGGVIKFNKILVPTDFSEHEEVERDFAWDFAKGFDSELMFLHVLELHDHEFSPRVLEEMMNGLLEKLGQRKKREAEDIKISEDVTRSFNAATGIVDYAEEENFDLIVMSTCGPGKIERFFLGSTTEKVISHSRTPILAIPSYQFKD